MTTEFKVGILVLVAIGVFAFFVIRIEGLAGFEDQQTYRVNVRFDSIAGLNRDAPVRLAGVRVGRVEEIGLTDDGRAEVGLRIQRDVEIRRDAEASVSSMGLLGEKYVEIRPGSREANTVADGEYIRGSRPTSVDQLVSVMSDISQDVKSTTESIRSVFGTEEAAERMQQILQNFQGTTAELLRIVQENREGMRSTVDSVERLSANLNESLPVLVSDMRQLSRDLDRVVTANEEEIGSSTENLQRMTERLDRSAAQIEEIVSKVNRGDGTLARLVNEPETVDKLNHALDSVDDALAAADTFFRRVGQAQFSFSLRSEFYEQSEATKNYFGVRMGLGAQGNRAFLLEAINDNIGSITRTTTRTEIFDREGELLDFREERRVVQEEGFNFSAMLAQRLDNWQLRGGLLEGEFGGGVDLYAGEEERWRFTFEAWDFGRDPDPHLKLRAQYGLFGRLFLTAGWDDLLSDDLRQFYFGAGFSFR